MAAGITRGHECPLLRSHHIMAMVSPLYHRDLTHSHRDSCLTAGLVLSFHPRLLRGDEPDGNSPDRLVSVSRIIVGLGCMFATSLLVCLSAGQETRPRLRIRQ